jgi:SAM-dependent methyltransferase
LKPILDMTCGSRMFWFDKDNESVEFTDIREYYEELPTGHVINVSPTTVADFRNLPFDDESFHLVVFDPPHLVNAGDNSWLAKKYGKLSKDTWEEDIAQGFREGMRVLKPYGTLIFKWNEDQIALPRVLKAIDYKPLFGQKRSKTQWLVFMKGIK